MTAFAGGFAGDQAAQQTMIAAGLQERTNLAQSFASGAVAYVVTEGVGSTPRLEPAVRPARSSERYGPINPGPLPEKIAQSFRGGSYTESTLSQPTVFYRAYGGKAGQLGSYWTRTPPSGPLQARVDLALRSEWGNTATNVVKIEAPAGTKIYEGFVEAQSGLLGGGSIEAGGLSGCFSSAKGQQRLDQ